jgi:hypothetical protein
LVPERHSPKTIKLCCGISPWKTNICCAAVAVKGHM